MPRPLRIEFSGAAYHVTSRGDRHEANYLGDADRRGWLQVPGLGPERCDAQALAYWLMGNRYHIVLRTRQANLSLLMRHLSSVYTRDFREATGSGLELHHPIGMFLEHSSSAMPDGHESNHSVFRIHSSQHP
jgi:putative transposase